MPQLPAIFISPNFHPSTHGRETAQVPVPLPSVRFLYPPRTTDSHAHAHAHSSRRPSPQLCLTQTSEARPFSSQVPA